MQNKTSENTLTIARE